MPAPAHARAPARAVPEPAAPRRQGPAPKGSRPTLRVVARPRRTLRFVLAIIVLAVVGVIGVVSLSALAAEAAFEARAIQVEVDELTLGYDELTAEVAALEAPARIRSVAESELGMVRAESPSFLVAEGAEPGPADSLEDRIKPVLAH